LTAPGGGAAADTEPRVVLHAAFPTVAGEVGIMTTHLSWLPWKAWRQARLVLELAAARPGPAVVAGDLNLPRRALRLRPPRPASLVAGPVHGRIRRRPILGGLLNEYEAAA
jgi:endonuclease/exonuclease/phosphatase family metal-dependent hydrolase